MARTFLELMQAACNELGIPEPQFIIGAQDDQSKQLLSLANREGKDFSLIANGQGGWQVLHKEYTFNTANGVADYALPSDFEYFLNRTFWDGAYKWELLGPISAQEKQLLRYGIVANGPRRKFYIRNNRMYIEPTPSDVSLIAYDYFSNAWCTSSMGTDQTQWQSDDDTYKLDENCFILGIKWRFLRAKGLDYSQEKADYENETQRVVSRDGGERDLPISGGTWGTRFLSDDQVPETGFGQ